MSTVAPRKGFLHRLTHFRGNSGGEDVTFFDNLVKTVEADLCVETTLRFSTGFSYGGAMSFAIACARPKEIRAIGVLSGSQLSGCSGGNDPGMRPGHPI